MSTMDKMTMTRRIRVGMRIWMRKAKEFVRFDSKALSLFLTAAYLVYYLYVRASKGRVEAILVIGKIFRHTQFPWIRMAATRSLLEKCKRHGTRRLGEEFLKLAGERLSGEAIRKLSRSVVEEEDRPFDKRLLILSPPRGDQKGVLIIKFTDYFKSFLTVFNMEKLCRDYVAVFEPSYSGYFDEDILCLLSVPGPVAIEASERQDYLFIESLRSDIYPVEAGANWWVDDRIFTPLDDLSKKYDITMVAIWADFKRHYHLFEAMSKARVKRKIALVGKPWEMTKGDIEDEARYYGVLDRFDFYEGLPQGEINLLLNKSRCLILLSKKEGFNKSIIEGMYAGVPVFILEGHNYGEKYRYINEETGGYIRKGGLASFLDDLDEILKRYENRSPGGWIRDNVSPEIATQRLAEVMKRIESEQSIRINPRLEIKVNTPEMDYYDPEARRRMLDSYRALKKYLR